MGASSSIEPVKRDIGAAQQIVNVDGRKSLPDIGQRKLTIQMCGYPISHLMKIDAGFLGDDLPRVFLQDFPPFLPTLCADQRAQRRSVPSRRAPSRRSEHLLDKTAHLQYESCAEHETEIVCTTDQLAQRVQHIKMVVKIVDLHDTPSERSAHCHGHEIGLACSVRCHVRVDKSWIEADPLQRGSGALDQGHVQWPSQILGGAERVTRRSRTVAKMLDPGRRETVPKSYGRLQISSTPLADSLTLRGDLVAHDLLVGKLPAQLAQCRVGPARYSGSLGCALESLVPRADPSLCGICMNQRVPRKDSRLAIGRSRQREIGRNVHHPRRVFGLRACVGNHQPSSVATDSDRLAIRWIRARSGSGRRAR